eukprot:13229424-Alexandrium_andersonii.AAC.1
MVPTIGASLPPLAHALRVRGRCTRRRALVANRSENEHIIQIRCASIDSNMHTYSDHANYHSTYSRDVSVPE